MLAKFLKISVFLIASLVLIACEQKEEFEAKTVFYLPVWEECFDVFEEFYQNDDRTRTEYFEFPKTKYVHPRLLGVMKISKSYKNATQFYPSVSCMSDSRTTQEYSSPVALRTIENIMEKVQSDGKPDLAYLVFEKNSYSIYWSEAEK